MEAFILSAVRTPIGKFLGGLSDLSAPKLGGLAVAEAIKRANIRAADVNEVILGNVVQAGTGMAPARQASLAGGVPETVPAVAINKVCGSGLKAVMLAAQAIRAGDANLLVAGGMESMSNAPYLLTKARTGYKYGDQAIQDSLLRDGLWCAFENWPMGMAAEHIAGKCGVSRGDQDAFAAESHQRAATAWERGDFTAEVFPVGTVTKDEGIRPDTTREKLTKLKPAFQTSGGTVTAGNSSQLSDGAAAVVVASSDAVGSLGAKPLARIVAYGASGVTPKDIFLAPVSAIQSVLAKAQLRLSDIDLIEINEAFAAQVLADGKELGLGAAKLNVNGGAVALGHPIGASGARVLVTLVHALHKRGGRYGLASLCLGGGNAVAMIVERVG